MYRYKYIVCTSKKSDCQKNHNKWKKRKKKKKKNIVRKKRNAQRL